MSLDFRKILIEEREKLKSKKAASPCIVEESREVQIEAQGEDQFLDIVSKLDFSVVISSPLETYRVGNVPSIFYIPDAISVETENALVGCINSTGDSGAWKSLRSRKLQCWGGVIPQAIEAIKIEPLPQWLDCVCQALVDASIFAADEVPNHVLINQYLGCGGILHHTDGPRYLGKTAIISLQSSCIMSFRHNLKTDEIGHKFGGDLFSLVLRPRSLLVFADSIYRSYMHGIEDDVHEQTVGDYGECLNLDASGAFLGEKVDNQSDTLHSDC
jgi:alkylated DNA repair protein alkB family protein 6